MHLNNFSIKNIRTIKDIEWKSLSTRGDRAGWHVIIGDNGSGKSTVLRAIALALVGQKNAEALRQDWSTWLSIESDVGSATVSVQDHSDDSWAKKGKKATNYYLSVGVSFRRVQGRVELKPSRFRLDPERHIWSEKPGWFAASFGPFRRFTGGDKDIEKLYYSHPRLARHLSVFGEDVALSECLTWLSQLRFEQLDNNAHSGLLLEKIKAFVNQDGFLPHGVRLDSVDSKGVRFQDGNGAVVPVNHLGDGFRSILSLAFELLRQMALLWPQSSIFADPEPDDSITVKHTGVVMIDEIDAHLHPTWQRRIGFWLTKHFPKVQFIVTTHSPLICHAAERGSIFRLPTPGSQETARMITGIEHDRLVFGSVLDAYGTEMFGRDVSRSETAKEKQNRLAELNQKALSSKLSVKEQSEREKLQSLFPASM